MTIKNLLNKTSNHLKKLGIENYNQEAELILSFYLKKPLAWIFSHSEEKINFSTKLLVFFALKKRKTGYSLAVIFKEKIFFSYNFFINKDVLVPRPETEILLEYILKETKIEDNNFSFIDIGTGSSCIPISFVNEIRKNSLIKKLDKCFAIDISKKALKVAKKNSLKHKTNDNIEFIKGNLLKPIIKKKIDFKTLIISANLPYLTEEQVNNSSSIKKEPKLALIAKNDGLFYYNELISQIKFLNFKKLNVIFEIDPAQTDKLIKNIENNFPKFKIKIFKDLRGLNRFITFKN